MTTNDQVTWPAEHPVLPVDGTVETFHARPFGMPDVPFGPREDDRVPFSWAERGLTWLHQTNPRIFGDMMLHVMNVERRERGNR